MKVKWHIHVNKRRIKTELKHYPDTHTPLIGDLKRLDDLEKQYGADWTTRKFLKEPSKTDKFYPFALRMHKAMLYKLLLKKIAPKVVKLPRGETKYENLSSHLRGSIVGYNGTRNGRNSLTPEEFYVKWLERKKNKKHHELVKEGEQKRDAVLWLIGKLMNKQELPISKPNVAQKTLSPQIQPKQKKQKLPKVIIPHGNAEEIAKGQHDVYYIDGGTVDNGTARQFSRICVFKNGDLFLEAPIGNKTNNEAEYHALIKALEDSKKSKTIIYSDSKLTVLTFLGEWDLKEQRLIVLRDEARKLMSENIAIEWRPREQNLAGFYLEEMYQI